MKRHSFQYLATNPFPPLSDVYRYGFQGQELVSPEEDLTSFKFRNMEPLLARFISVDPLYREYAWMSPFAFAENDPIRSIDLEGRERLIVTQYLYKISGERIQLSYGIWSDDGDWKGDVYREHYFFEGKKDGGSFAYYSEGGKDLAGTAMMKMMGDNKAYFKALHIYHQIQQEKFNRCTGDALIIIGGVITTIASGGTGTKAYASLFGVTTGVFTVGAGSGKLALDAMGKFESSDLIPTSPLGGVGLLIDAFRSGDDLTFKNLGDFATTLISAFGGGASAWKSWDALNTADKIMTSYDMLKGLYDQLGGEPNELKLIESAKEFTEITQFYSDIQEAND